MNADDLHRRGVRRFERGDLKGAVREYTRAIELGRPRPEFHNDRRIALKSLGETARAMDDYAAALEDYTRAIRLDRRMGAAWFGRAGAHQVLATLVGADGEVTLSNRTYKPSRKGARKHLESVRADFKKARGLAKPGAGYLAELARLLRDVEKDLKRLKA